MKNIKSIFEEKYGWVTFNKKDYILKGLMKPTGIEFSNDIIEMAAEAIDDNDNSYMVYWKINKNDIDNPNYDDVDRIKNI